MILMCEICREKIGIVDEDKLDKPVLPEMFVTLDPEHKRPAPFVNQTCWRDMRCPYCRKRPFINESEILTDGGKVPIRKAFKCDKCGKAFNTAKGVEMHKLVKKSCR